MSERFSTTAVAFTALMGASAVLALGPWLVRAAEVGAVAAGFWRLSLAVPMLGILAIAFGQSLRPPPGRLLGLIVLGAFFFAGDLAAWHEGIHLTKLGNATLFGNFGSFMFAVYGLVLARKWPHARQVAALLLALLGAVALMSSSLELGIDNVHGDLLSLAAGIFYGLYLIAVDKVRLRIEPLLLIFWASTLGAIFILPLALATDEPLVPGRWEIVALLALTSQVIGQGLLIFAIGKLPQLVVGLGLIAQVAVSAVLGWITYGEAFTLLDWVGVIAIIMALQFVRNSRSNSRDQEQSGSEYPRSASQASIVDQNPSI